MTKYFLTLLACSLLHICSCQNLCDFQKTRSGFNRNTSRHNPREVSTFNQLAKHFDLTDTITYVFEEDKTAYFYRKQPIEQFKYNADDIGQRLMIDFKPDTPAKYRIYIPTKRGKAQLFELAYSCERNQTSFKEFHLNNRLPEGEYIERNCEGTIVIEGQYCQIDSTYSTQRTYLDREVYQEVTEVNHYEYFSFRSGTWKYYDDDGKLIKEDTYQDCK